MAAKPYYITTAIAYPNGVPHIGHAYEAIATDAIARFMRLDGYDVFFLTGTDEHGSKMLQTAAQRELTPRQLVERNVPRFQAMVKLLDCSNDDFIRTTEPRHYRSSASDLGGHAGLRRYLSRQICRLVFGARRSLLRRKRDQLDDNEQRVGPQGTPVDWVEEESYFFKLSAYQDKLLALYAGDPRYVLPRERLNEVMSFVKGGLQDLSISRTTFDWGVPCRATPNTLCMSGSMR